MKRLSAIILSVVMALSVCACGGGSKIAETTTAAAETSTVETTTTAEETTAEETAESTEAQVKDIHSVGEEIPSDYFPFIVTDASFTDSINPVIGEAFLLPESENGFNAGDGYKWLSYEVDYTYKGKSSLSLVSSLFSPKVTYGDYTFDTDYFTFVLIDGTWYILDNDNKAIGHPLLQNLSSNGFSKYEPLSDDVYVIRGIIKVPNKAVEDTETPIILALYNVSEATPTAITGKRVKVQIDR